MDYALYGKNGLYLIVEDEPGGQVVGAFYALLEAPGWWWGHALGREQKLHMPDADPHDVAVTLMQPTPSRDSPIRPAAPASQDLSLPPLRRHLIWFGGNGLRSALS